MEALVLEPRGITFLKRGETPDAVSVMNIVAIGLSHNEADIVTETVTSALSWVNHFIIYDDSTDGTGDLARAAGAIVIPGKRKGFDEGLRQITLDAAAELEPDWIVRIDMDEIYHHDPDPRRVLYDAMQDGAFCVRALSLEFWLTLDDVRRGLILEDDTISVQLRRRWYTCGHMAMVAWLHRPDLHYEWGSKKNVPTDAEGRDVSQVGNVFGEYLVQKHYTGRSLPQLLDRMRHRTNYWQFGKYRHNLIVDETVGLHYLGTDGEFDFKDNHDVIYRWYDRSEQMFKARIQGCLEADG